VQSIHLQYRSENFDPKASSVPPRLREILQWVESNKPALEGV